MSPHVEDMTDKQRRWWFAQMDPSEREQKEPAQLQIPPPYDSYRDRQQDDETDEEKEHRQGTKDGWAYVLSNGKTSQPDKNSDDPYTKGFRKGVTDAHQWVTTMKERCERLTQTLQNAWDTFVNSLPAFGAGVKKTPGAGDVKRYSEDELARRLNTTTDDFHHNIKKTIKTQFRSELKQIGNPSNPDILVDRKGNVWLRNLKTGMAINTRRPLSAFRR